MSALALSSMGTMGVAGVCDLHHNIVAVTALQVCYSSLAAPTRVSGEVHDVCLVTVGAMEVMAA